MDSVTYMASIWNDAMSPMKEYDMTDILTILGGGLVGVSHRMMCPHTTFTDAISYMIL